MFQGNFEEKKIEILAPAGSFDSFRAAIHAGADAVYAGGSRFGARAFAQNFTQEQLLEAIDYAHVHGSRFYLTVNTLLKDGELEELPAYLEPLYLGGLDAVIVQDTGVLERVRSHFPDLEIHVSTQMTLTGVQGAAFLKRMGAVRVVPARELSLEEIRDIKTATGMEIECFVHGALCYCYSGQCLLSSLIGGRSGNRGQCAQPCRLPYRAGDREGYLLSLKDICTLDLIPQLIEAGIDSFKIEGRMKRPEYVAGVTAMYRKYTDRYLSNPNAPYQVEEADKEMLLDLFNRGGFHTGYYTQKNGRDMITDEKPGHAGVAAGKVLEQKGREVKVRALTQIQKGDVLDFSKEEEKKEGGRTNRKYTPEVWETGNGYTCGADCSRGDTLTILAPKGKKVCRGSYVYRIRNQKLLEQLEKEYVNGKKQEKIYGFLSFSVGKPAKLVVCCKNISVETESEDIISRADTRPLEEERIRRQMLKTGNTEFVFERLDIETDGAGFLPMQQINELRRRGLELLQKEICGSFHRESPPVREEADSANDGCTGGREKPQEKAPYVSVLVETAEQMEAVRQAETAWQAEAVRQAETAWHAETGKQTLSIRRIYLDAGLDANENPGEFWERTCGMWKEAGVEVFLSMPRIFRKQTAARFAQMTELLKSGCFDGILIRTYEEYEFLKTVGFDRTLILDHNLYVMNKDAKKFWEKEDVYNYTIPVELNAQEIKGLGAERGELIVYGYLPAMVSAQCVTATVKGCTGKPQVTELVDRYRNPFPMKNFCRDCYNVIYNTKAQLLFDEKDALQRICPAGYRLQFTVETKKETEEIMKLFRECMAEGKSMSADAGRFTRGHFRRGVS